MKSMGKVLIDGGNVQTLAQSVGLLFVTSGICSSYPFHVHLYKLNKYLPFVNETLQSKVCKEMHRGLTINFSSDHEDG